jgi:hypothetical protein
MVSEPPKALQRRIDARMAAQWRVHVNAMSGLCQRKVRNLEKRREGVKGNVI